MCCGWPRVINPYLRIVLSYTLSYDAAAKAALQPKLNISWTPTSADISHSSLTQNGARDYDNVRTPYENTMRFLNANNRRIPSPRPRAIHESCELMIPVGYRKDYESLLALIRDGGDLKPYLSRDVLKKGRPDRNDGLLNSWGIQHLHFRTAGTDQLLFCMITDTDVFMIQTLPHNEKHLWVDRQLLQIMHDNWPEQISKGKVNCLSRENHPADKSATLRGLNANFLTTMDDGTIYLAPGGGMMASGDSQEDKMNCSARGVGVTWLAH